MKLFIDVPFGSPSSPWDDHDKLREIYLPFSAAVAGKTFSRANQHNHVTKFIMGVNQIKTQKYAAFDCNYGGHFAACTLSSASSFLTFLPCRVVSDSRVSVGVFFAEKVEYFFMLIGSSFFPMVSFFCCMLCDWNSMVANRFAQWGKIWQGNFYQKLELWWLLKGFFFS